MAVHLRLMRTGTKKQVSYRVVATDSRARRDSHYIEIIGSYNPRTNPVTVKLKSDRIQYWLGKGARPSEAVRDLITQVKV